MSEHTPLGPGPEFDLVRAMLARWGESATGTGDDAALLDVPPDRQLVVSTDLSVEDVHFRREWLSPAEIAYRAAAAAVSDLAAMAASPLAMTVALTLPDAWREHAEALADGLGEVARSCETPIVGGDLTLGDKLSLGVTVFGTVERGRALTRGGAREGQVLWLTGRLGGPGRALRDFIAGETPGAADRHRFAHPVPRLRESQWLATHGVTSAIDCSDGVVADTGHLAAASRVRIVVNTDALPLVAGADCVHATTSGEEYELIVTGPPSLDTQAFEQLFGVPLTAIGRVEHAAPDLPGVITLRNGRRVTNPLGYDHFVI